MNELMLPILIVVIASVFQGTFGLGMKYVKPLAWEAWWLVHATIAMLIFPLAWALIAVPDLFGVIGRAPTNELFSGSLMGFLWGIGGIMFGVSVGYIGMSLTYGIVMGLCAIAGAVTNMIIKRGGLDSASLPYILAGLVLLAIGVIVVTVGGLKRDKLLAEAGEQIEGIKKGKAFRAGLIIASTCGILSAMLAVGFGNTETVGKLAEDAGASTRNGALARWVVVLAGAYVMNAGYALILLIKNNSFSSYKTPGMTKALKWSVIAGLLWFAALGLYGQGVALWGPVGEVVGWPILLGLSLIVSSAVAVMTGEWKGAGGPLRVMLVGIAFIILASVVMALPSFNAVS